MLKPMYVFFGKAGTKHMSRWLSPLKGELKKSNLNILYEIYVGKMLTMALLTFVASISLGPVILTYFGMSFSMAVLTALAAGALFSVIVIVIYHSYPFHLITSKKSSIEANQPFAMNHMAAISASGVPPFVIFKLLSNIPEYGEISNESKRIVRNVDTFGMDMISAIRNVAERTPSTDFRQFLNGIIATVDTGGDLKKYLENSAKDALFSYRLRREKYVQTLSTYADFYTAILIAAPLFFVSILSIMSLIGGSVMGLSIPDAMQLGIFVLIPIMNTAFIMFVHYTQPSM